MRVKALIVRTGVPLPPAGGPARCWACIGEGKQALAAAQRAHAKSVIRLGPLLPPGGWTNAPSALGLDKEGAGHALATVGGFRVERWFELADYLKEQQREAKAFGGSWLKRELDDIEALLRSGLGSAADAYNFFDDVRYDLGGSTMIQEEGREVGLVDDLLDESHRLTHVLGDIVGGLFGCEIVLDGDGWFDHCVTSLLHVRYGNSMGFTARHECTVCQQDFSTCNHLREATYLVTVTHDDNGECSVCGEHHCPHPHGTVLQVTARSVMTDIKLHEVSLVPRPRDPLARITAREIDIGDLTALLGESPSSKHRVLDHGCMYQCHGFTGLEPTDQVSWFNAAPNGDDGPDA